MAIRSTKMTRVSDDEFHAVDCSMTMKRENGLTPNGNPLGGRWVLRDACGKMIDFDQYANDLAGRYDLDIF